MSGEYVPVSQKTPAQREAYNRSNRERNRRYYARKKGMAVELAPEQTALEKHYDEHGSVPCIYCQIEVIPVCGFCRNGLA